MQNAGTYPQPYMNGGEVVSIEQYRYALTNFKIAHEKVESQRLQLEEQERQVAQLRARIAALEGTDNEQRPTQRAGGQSVDDFSIRNAASQLEKQLNRWAAEVVRLPPAPLEELKDAALADLNAAQLHRNADASPMFVQGLLRHAMAELISEGIINCLIVTNSTEANIHLARIHEYLFDRDPTVACVWRRQTFSAAVDSCTPAMSLFILSDQMPNLAPLVIPEKSLDPLLSSIVDSAYAFSRMLHGSKATSGGMADAFYRSFVPELSAVLSPRQVELVKRCISSERGRPCKVGATIFPGLVKVSRAPQASEAQQAVVRRAQVMCECALGLGSDYK